MCVAIEKEQVVAGFINRNEDGLEFTMEEIDNYISSLWNAGCGPVRFNFWMKELPDYLNCCEGVCLRRIESGCWKIDKSFLSDKMSPKERELCHNDPNLAKSFDLFCRLQVDFRTDSRLLDAMGFRFLYA